MTIETASNVGTYCIIVVLIVTLAATGAIQSEYRSIRSVSNTRRKQSRENAPAKYHIYVKLPLNANVVFRWSKGLCQLS